MVDSRLSVVDDHPVATFFVGAYLFTWLISAPAYFMEVGWTAWILIWLGSFGAPVSAAVVTWLRGDDVGAWARQILHWRVGWRWWAVALGLPILAAVLISLALAGIRGPVDLDQAFAVSPVLFVGMFLFAMLLSGGLNEEPGWRGFAQAHLNEKYGALGASLIVGVVWAGWHLPYFVIPITPHSGFTTVNQVGWFVSIVLLSVILAWAYNGTGSVLIVMVLHAMVNTADILLPLAPDQLAVNGVIVETAVATVTVTQVAVTLLVVVAIVAYFGRESLARGEIPGAADFRDH